MNFIFLEIIIAVILIFFTMEIFSKPAIFKLESLTKPKKFCGHYLGNVVSTYCRVHNSPASSEERIKRSIVEECCHQPCNLTYIMYQYCLEINRDALKKHIHRDEDIDEFISKIGNINTEEIADLEIPEPSNSREKRNNCPCKKHKKNRKNKKSKSRKTKRDKPKKHRRPKKANVVPQAKVGVIEESPARAFYVY